MALLQVSKERTTKDVKYWVFYDYIYFPDGSKKYIFKKYATKYELYKLKRIDY